MKNYIRKTAGILALLLALGLGASAASHKHTFAKEWTGDETGHWHAATCEHVEEKNGFKEHKYDKYVSNKDGTCETDGTKSRKCKDCGYVETVTEENSKIATNHVFSQDWTSDETSHWHAAVCEHKDEISGKAEHNYGSYVSNKDASCGADGTKTRVCKDCGFEETVVDEGSKLPHTYAKEWTNDETSHWHAAVCEHKDEISGKADHNYGSYVSNKDASCGADGTKTRVCKDCGFEETVVDEGSKLPHTYAKEWTNDETSHWHVATCEHKDEISGKVEHNFGKYISNKDGNCEKDGTQSRLCKDCGYVETVTEPNSKTNNHPMSDKWTSDKDYHWHAATCSHSDYFDSKAPHESDEGTVTKAATSKADGEKVYKCKICGSVIKTEVLPKLYAFHETVQKVDTVEINGTKYDIVTFGDWPQTIKANGVTVDETQSITMGAYTYYLGSDNFYYAKCRENAYSSYDAEYSNGSYPSRWSENSWVYFKVEPIRWRVLTKNYNGTKKSLLFAEQVLMGGIPYFNQDSRRKVNGKEIYSTNYQHSQIRAYLNGLGFVDKEDDYGNFPQNKMYEKKGFLQTAFTATAQGKIANTTVDNSAASTSDAAGNVSQTNSNYICANTTDKIFLLSEKEATTVPYGFALYNKSGDQNTRIRRPTDFALANYTYENYGRNRCYWWLRSPRDYNYASYIGESGYAYNTSSITYSYYGIVPALTISY